ncbi:MAG: indole-3-glycerol phosphate synthase [Thermoproteota archaeon]|nr:indole-3-glycerol phosphate synthase [Thermoproteota archaeon]
MVDLLDRFAEDAKRRVNEGYYYVEESISNMRSLREAILGCERVPIITEVKAASPSLGVIKESMDVDKVSLAMQSGGSTGISVLTEPNYFHGSLDYFIKVRRQVSLPLLMKDFIVSFVQVDAASRIGANAVLLIKTLFDRDRCECDVNTMIEYVHSKNLEVLLESHSLREFSSSLDSDADLVGINNRDLRTLKVDLKTTQEIMENSSTKGKIIVSESGVENASDVRNLFKYGVRAFLVGSSIMSSSDIEAKVRELVNSFDTD